MKKLISLLAIISILAVPLTASADYTTDTSTYGDFECVYNSAYDYLSIRKYIGSDTELVVPKQIEGYTVGSIDDCFGDLLPDTVTSLLINAELRSFTLEGDYPNLKEISLPDTPIGYVSVSLKDTAYYKAPDNWSGDALYIGKHLMHLSPDLNGELVIKHGTLSIPEFISFAGATKITFPGSLTKIRNGGLYANSTVEELVFREGVEEIEIMLDYAGLSENKELKKIVLPDSVKSLDLELKYSDLKPTIYCSENNTVAIEYAKECELPISYITPSKILQSADVPNASVVYENGAEFVYDAQFYMIKADENALDQTVKAALKDHHYTAYDLTLRLDDTVIQPSGALSVTLPVPSGYNPNRCVVYYVTNKNRLEDMQASVKNNALTFTTDHFSTYVIAEKIPVTTSTTTSTTTTSTTSSTEHTETQATTTTTEAQTTSTQATVSITTTASVIDNNTSDSSPNTGDSDFLIGAVIVLMISGVVILFMGNCKKSKMI